MPSTYTPGGIELIGDGEQSGSWGGTTNTNLQILDRMISQAGSITLSGTTHTLTISDGTLSDGQYGILVFGGSPSGTNTVTISPNDAQRSYIVKNDSGQSVVLTQGSGGNVTVADGKTALVYCDGAGSGAAVADLTADLAVTALTLADLGVTASASELNILDGATLSTAELNILDGVTATTAELNILDGVTATTAELNILDGVTATATELNLLDGITALSGSDTEIVTGTAGTDGQIGKWNADGDLIGVGTNTADGDVVVLEDVGGNPGLPAVDGSQLTGVSAETMFLTEEQTSGTNGGASSVGWNPRLNTLVHNGITGASFSTPTITLPAGTYEVQALAANGAAPQHKLRMYDIDNTASLADGLVVSRTASGEKDYQAPGFMRFTLAGETDVRLEHYHSAANATFGLGFALSQGTEIYAQCIIKKVA